MPPHVPRKRLREASPGIETQRVRGKIQKPSKSSSNHRKTTLYDDLDAAATSHSLETSGPALHHFSNDDDDDDDSDGSLSSLSDAEFEDVPLAKRPKLDASSDDENLQFEDVAAPLSLAADAPVISGDLELTLNRDTRISLTNPFGLKKGVSKRERMVRNATHCLHVMCLLWHNAIRNSWLCDQEVQAIMLSHLPPRVWEDVDRWRRNSGLVKPPTSPKTQKKQSQKSASRKRESRDWGLSANRVEDGAVDMSHGDPLFRLMQTLVAWWKQRFRSKARGLRKWGYMSLERLDRLTKAHKEDAAEEGFGERISGLDEFRQYAVNCAGSRDVGSHLFTALLRGLGLEARMVASLQPLGFGWTKLEDADPEETNGSEKGSTNEKDVKAKTKKEQATQKLDKSANTNTTSRASRPTRLVAPSKSFIVPVSDDLELEYKDTDDESVIELKVTPKKLSTSSAKFDKDLEYPHYWTEILSPVTGKYLAVEPIIKGTIATNRELTETFEPRGAKADKAKQVTCYIIGYSQDGTAKDVTIRYLKRQIFPGRTKGVRIPLEKIPVYNHHGKVKQYEHYDWFKSAMSGYTRGNKLHPLTEADDKEQSTDLKPSKPEKKEVKEGEETLQYYKQSKEFVLARHLKREEALRSGAKPVKIFKNKGKASKADEENVYLRTDVLLVKSAETWHKQGRAPLPGEEPLKRVPYRAATLNRKREILEVEATTGEKVLQGLFSYEQTNWIIPPPIKDGIIPKNEYGNIDMFVEHMCPPGAVHVPFKGVVKVCKRLQIDYAEAVVDFEFGHRMAVPVIQGVVIAAEHHNTVMEELGKDEAERVRKEDEKRRKGALGRWRKFLMGLRIIERIRQDYGEVDDSISVFGHHGGPSKPATMPEVHDEDMAGGFLPEGYEEEEDDDKQAHHTSSFFPPVNESDDEDEDDAAENSDFVLEDHRHEANPRASEPHSPRGANKSKTTNPKPTLPPPPPPRRSKRRRGRARHSDNDDSDAGGDWVNPDDDDNASD